MERFTDQPLSATPHIAVLGSDKVGNFVVTTPLLRGLKEKYPGAIVDFYGSEVTRSFEVACSYIDARFSLFGGSDETLAHLSAFVRARCATAGGYDLAINCNGYSEACVVLTALLRPRYVVGQTLRADLRGLLPEGECTTPHVRLNRDPQWNRASLSVDYPDLLTSGYVAEILCRLAYVETDFNRVEAPTRTPRLSSIPDILIHTTASRTAKEWPRSYWCEVIAWCLRHGWSVGLVGLHGPSGYGGMTDTEEPLLSAGAQDLRDALSLPELAGAFQCAQVAIAVDSGPLHIAAAVGCPTIGLYGNDADGDGASPFHLWAPRGRSVHHVLSPFKCRLCAQAAFRNTDCLVSGHPCLQSLMPRSVIEALKKLLCLGA